MQKLNEIRWTVWDWGFLIWSVAFAGAVGLMLWEMFLG